MDRLSQLRAFAQSRSNTFPLSGYPQLPLQQPRGFLSWPWIKQKKLFTEYLRFSGDAPLASDVKIDYSPLLWCKQARTEALKFFCEENHLIRVTVFAKKGETLKEKRILDPVDQLCVPIELFDEEMLATLEKGVALHMQLGEGCGKAELTRATNCVYDKIFAYNRKSWIEYCQILATNTVRVYPGMTINLHPRYRSNFRDLIPDLLLPLSFFRFAENVHVVGMMSNPFFSTLATVMSAHPASPWEWHDLLLGLIEEAGFRARTDFDAGYVFISRAFTIAEIAMGTCMFVMEQPGFAPYVNGTLALCTKTSIIYAWAIHLLLESKVSNGQYDPDHYQVLEKMYLAVCNSRTWPGMSSRQLGGALFVSGLFYEHLADYLATPSNMAFALTKPFFNHGMNISGHRKHAAHCFSAASQIEPTKFGDLATQRWEALYQKFGAGIAKEVFEVKMETMTTLTGGTWFGWKVMWEKWGIENLPYLEVIRKKEVAVMSKSQVKRLRERLGLGNCRKEPAGLLRCLAG